MHTNKKGMYGYTVRGTDQDEWEDYFSDGEETVQLV
jgi:hypothetical protein